MKLIITLLGIIALTSCRNSGDKFSDDTSIATTVYKAQQKYLDDILISYGQISKIGYYYWTENNFLELQVNKFKEKIRSGQILSEKEEEIFFDHFQKTFNNYSIPDFDITNQLKRIPIKSISDINILEIYIKNNFVVILLNNKGLPFDTWSTMATSRNWTIKNGEVFKVDLATTACNSTEPNDWYLVKENIDSTLTKENIIDTLYPDRFGIVNFKTRNYKKGENRLMFISRLNVPRRDRMVSREVIFYVK